MRVVAHFLDGRVLKGESLDVDPGRSVCHITPAGGTRVEVELGRLKALYVVRSLAGDAAHEESSCLRAADQRRRGAHPIELAFSDGERLRGLTIHSPPVGPHFFLLPADPCSNNLRILVNRAAVTEMRVEPDAGVVRRTA